MMRMRTTVLIDDRLGRTARNRARKEGISFSALVTRALRDDLARIKSQPPAPPFRLVTVGGSGVRPGIDLDRSSELLTAEDETAQRGRRKAH